MDDLKCQGEVVHQTLQEIAFINKTLGGNNATLSGLSLLLRDRKGAFKLVDLGCGGGEMLGYIFNWGIKNGLDLNLCGIDANPHIVEFARRQNKHFDFLCKDVSSDDFDVSGYDVLTCTLFTHHFQTAQLSILIKKWVDQVKVGIVINDLHRHPFAYYSIKILTSFFSRSSMVKHDAPLSVLRGFSRNEWKEILHDAGINNYSLRWKWAFRWELVIYKQ